MSDKEANQGQDGEAARVAPEQIDSANELHGSIDSGDRMARARQARHPKKENGETAARMNPIERARAQPKSFRRAVNAKCYDCIGQDGDPNWRGSIRGCVCTDCPLYAVRPFQRKEEKQC